MFAPLQSAVTRSHHPAAVTLQLCAVTGQLKRLNAALVRQQEVTQHHAPRVGAPLSPSRFQSSGRLWSGSGLFFQDVPCCSSGHRCETAPHQNQDLLVKTRLDEIRLY